MHNTTFNLFGVEVDNITIKEALDRARQFLFNSRGRLIFTPNPEIILRAKTNPRYRQILNSGNLLLPDGYGLILASRFLKTPLQERVTGVDFLEKFIKVLHQNQHSCYILLHENGLTKAEEVRRHLDIHYPRLNFCCQSVNNHYLASGHLIDDINEFAPDVLIVTFGAPLQERWLYNTMKHLPAVQIGFTGGGAIDMLVGSVKRAPLFWQKAHLEWLWRFLKSPRSFKWMRFKRIWRAVVIFPWEILKLRLRSTFIFRKNILGFIYKNKNAILIIHKKRYKEERRGAHGHWALPQGGIEHEEPEKCALKREIYEELGIKSIQITAKSRHVHRYRWSPFYRNFYSHNYAGQKQSCWYVKFIGNDNEIRKNYISDEHIDSFSWVSQKELLKKIEPARGKIVKKLLKEFNNKKIYQK